MQFNLSCRKQFRKASSTTWLSPSPIGSKPPVTLYQIASLFDHFCNHGQPKYCHPEAWYTDEQPPCDRNFNIPQMYTSSLFTRPSFSFCSQFCEKGVCVPLWTITWTAKVELDMSRHGLSPSKMVTPDQYCSHTWSPLATNGPTLPCTACSELVDIGKCTRKDETVQSALGWVFNVS